MSSVCDSESSKIDKSDRNLPLCSISPTERFTIFITLVRIINLVFCLCYVNKYHIVSFYREELTGKLISIEIGKSTRKDLEMWQRLTG